MCRIHGVFGTRALQPRARHISTALLFTGGPDQQAWASGTIHHEGCEYHWVLGNNRLAITDLAGGDQPYRHESLQCMAVFNGEIYGHRALRSRLEGKHRFVDDCDGRVVLPLYAERGLDFPSQLDGMFAIAIIDPHHPRLVLAVDSAGIKPLYYHWDGDALYFASEIPALLELSGCPRELRPEGIDAYLTGRAIYGIQTIFRDIQRLPPGSVMTVEPGHSPRIFPYAIEPLYDEIRPVGDFAADAASLRQLLEEEVRSLLIADVPVATMNSGGLDSSIIAALAARHHPGIHSFHIRYKGNWPSDESSFAPAGR